MKSDLKNIADLQKSLNTKEDPSKTLKSTLDCIRDAGFARARIYRLKENSSILQGVSSTGMDNLDFEFSGFQINLQNDPAFSATIDNRKPTIFTWQDQDTPKAFQELFPEKPSWIDVPLYDQDRFIGMIAVDNAKSGRKFTERDAEFLEIVANLLSKHWVQTEENLTNYLVRLKKTMVLILGKDSGEELKLLRKIETYIKRLKFMPQLVKDVPDIPEMSNEEKMSAIASACKFVLMENSYPAGQIAEAKILSTNRIVTGMLRQEGKGSTWMIADYEFDFKFMKEFVYTLDTLKDAVSDACDWATEHVEIRRQQLNEMYPWRKKKP